jgi:hypothetical protein
MHDEEMINSTFLNKMINLKKSISDIILDNRINELYIYDTDNLIIYSSIELKIYISNLLEIINENIIYNSKNYKLEYYTPLIKYIINIIINYENKKKIIIDIFNNNSLFLQKLTVLNKGQKYLEQIKKYIPLYEITENEIYCYMLIACKSGTLLTFLFWYSISGKKLLDDNEYTLLLTSAIKNSDDRIFKNLLTIKYSNDELNNQNINDILTELFSSVIPNKYKLKRLKFLSTIINLENKYEYMLSLTNNIKIVLELTKYYYKHITFEILNNLFQRLSLENDILIYYENIYYLLKTNEEKNIFKILMSLFKPYYESNIIKYIGSYNLIIENNYIAILNYFFHNNVLNKGNKYIETIFKYYTDNNFINKYLLKNKYNTQILYLQYTRFYIPFDKYNLVNIKVNKILHFLRIISKKFKKNKINNFKKNTNLLLNELNNYKPNKKYNILKNGSITYQYEKIKFNKIPPRHLLPMELYSLSNCLIKEKSDGVLINILPNYIFPENNDIYNYDIKAEWIEELNLYLIFDIDIPNTTIIERQNILRNLHPYTCCLNNFKEIYNISDLINYITEERIILNKFINDNPEEIKWYPKGAWKINNINDIFYKDIINYIEELDDNINNFININNDGLIITPLNGLREIKIKPKSLLTIDLLFDGSNWLDDNKTIYNNILNKVENNNIYRFWLR